MPVFLVLVLFEKWYGWRKGQDTVRTMDMISSLSSGITNVTKDVLGLSIGIISYGWMVNKLAIFTINNTILTYVVGFIIIDFQSYWIHRWSHKINIFWNRHIIHHSSEEFNLACALRQSISSIVNLFTFLLLPAALLGVPVQVIAVIAPLHLFAQFWYHTRHIGKMGFLEKILVTPSHHRVHHAINPEYLDKNLAAIFICWDKWFGTFQEELPHVACVYGITRPAATWNPIRINFQHLWLLIQDAWRTKNIADKFRIWFMPTGWRPADTMERYPVSKIEDPYHFEKYNPAHHRLLPAWSWFQLSMILLFLSYFFANIASIGAPNIFVYGAFIFLCVHATTELMDGNPNAWIFETVKNMLAIAWMARSGDWFGISTYSPLANGVLYGYFITATCIVGLFCIALKKQDRVKPATVAA
ncbi:MAG TPA: sterol desaturase family protein [Phnomibacter sp.]|nr:sterol desaturase family protein [Phnomibacter sp.]